MDLSAPVPQPAGAYPAPGSCSAPASSTPPADTKSTQGHPWAMFGFGVLAGAGGLALLVLPFKIYACVARRRQMRAASSFTEAMQSKTSHV